MALVGRVGACNKDLLQGLQLGPQLAGLLLGAWMGVAPTVSLVGILLDHWVGRSHWAHLLSFLWVPG